MLYGRFDWYFLLYGGMLAIMNACDELIGNWIINMTSTNFLLNRVFSKRIFNDAVVSFGNETYASTIKRYVEDYHNKTNYDAITNIYKIIDSEYRNEYFYKNTLLNKLLLGRHSVNTTTALTEIPVGKSKADFIMINGIGQVYEVKTGLDNFDRLETQTNDYFKAFDHVCIVTDEANYEKACTKIYNPHIGIILLSNEGTLREVKKSKPFRQMLSSLAMFKVLRKGEFEAIIKRVYGTLPKTSQVEYYDACYEMFSKIKTNVLHSLFLCELKKRSIVKPDIKARIPKELRAIAYFSNYKEVDYNRLDDFLSKECLECISHI
ncbi:MAG: sce7726 family protein [Clostridiales Family XIII bacterium]|jgi:hypothetical protein|nr:sce7726 family protein [Clostridiales Family XIII bacterium]